MTTPGLYTRPELQHVVDAVLYSPEFVGRPVRRQAQLLDTLRTATHPRELGACLLTILRRAGYTEQDLEPQPKEELK